MRLRGLQRVACVLLPLSLLAACSNDSAQDDKTVVGRASAFHKLTVGVSFDQPGVGYRRPDGKAEGFDVEVALYIAKELGVKESDVAFKEAHPADREDLIRSGQVDLIVATYSITEKRRQIIEFAGPYFTAGQDLLVRANNDTITGPESLNGKRLCSVENTTSAQEVKDRYAKSTQLVEFFRFSECLTALFIGDVDAVTTDDIILAGYAAQNPDLLKVVGKPFSKERYGIGLRKDDAESRKRINDAIKKMIDTGAWQKALRKTIGPSGYKIPTPPTVDNR